MTRPNISDEEARERTAKIIEELKALGRTDEAWHMHRTLEERASDTFLLALREACETVLTMIEAIDPATETLLEELRADVDAWLTPQHPPVTET